MIDGMIYIYDGFVDYMVFVMFVDGIIVEVFVNVF